MVAITRSGQYYLTGFGLAFLLGLIMGHFTYLIIGLCFVGVLIFGMRATFVDRVSLERELSSEHVTVGQIIKVRVTATLERGAGFVLLHDRIPAMFDLVEGNNIHVVWKGRAAKRVRFTYAFKCTKRGGYTIPGTQAVSISAMGLIEAVPISEGEHQELTVEPRVLRVRKMKPIRGRARTIFPSGDRAKIGTTTTDFNEIREYERGDPLKNVNWKATAKASRGDDVSLMVNEYEVEGKKAVWCFIDAADYMEVGSTLQNTFDQTVEAALEILEHFISRGYRVGGTVFNTVGTGKDAPVFYPDTGRPHYLKIVKTLTGLTTSGSHEGLGAAVERVRGFLVRERPLVLLVTRPEGDFDGTVAGIKRIMGHAASDRRAGSPVMLIAPRVQGAAREAQDVSDLALILAEEEANAHAKALRRMGVSLVEWDPKHSPVAAVLSRGVRSR